MSPLNLQAAEHIAQDVRIVRQLLQERADLLAVVEELASVERRAGVGKELMNKAKSAITKARTA